jgi:hypothetical protein
MKMYSLVVVAVICTSYQVFQSTQVFVVLRAETLLDVPVERTDGAVRVVSAALPSASSNRIPNASLKTRQQAIADLQMPAVPELNNTNATTSALYEPPRPHPHAGARDADGNWGYVADVTRIRRWMLQRYREAAGANTTSSTSLAEAGDELLPPSSYLPLAVDEIETVCGTQPGKGFEGKHGWDVVIKVVLNGPNPLPLPSSENRPTSPEPRIDTKSNNSSSTPYVPPTYIITTPEPNGVSQKKILCGIYSYDKMDYRIQGVSETWGWRCDGFLPVSTVTIDDPAIRGYGSVDVPHYGPEEYKNMWQKTRSILAYMYDNYFDDYEYFYLAGDDTHVVVENLRRYLYTVEQTHDVATEPLYMGMPFALTGWKNLLFNIGGAGYVLNRVALKRLVLEAFPTCYPKTQLSEEDQIIARCLKSMKIVPLHTVDAYAKIPSGWAALMELVEGKTAISKRLTSTGEESTVGEQELMLSRSRVLPFITFVRSIK